MDEQERNALASLRCGDISGLEGLVRLYQARALRTAYLLTKNRQVAEDVVADAFLAVYHHIAQFDDRQPFAPWFTRIVVNGALKALRHTQRRSPVEDHRTVLAQQVDPAPGIDTAVELQEMRRTLLDAVDALPAAQRVALVLHYYLDMDEHVIAQSLGVPLGTVKWRLYAARKRLRRRLPHAEGSLRGYVPEGEVQ